MRPIEALSSNGTYHPANRGNEMSDIPTNATAGLDGRGPGEHSRFRAPAPPVWGTRHRGGSSCPLRGRVLLGRARREGADFELALAVSLVSGTAAGGRGAGLDAGWVARARRGRGEASRAGAAGAAGAGAAAAGFTAAPSAAASARQRLVRGRSRRSTATRLYITTRRAQHRPR